MTRFNIVDGRFTQQESDRLEFKSSRSNLSKDFWPTYSAFANTFGGTIVIGVDDSTYEPVGVEDPEKLIKELWDLLNDGKKVNVNLLSPKDIEVIEVSGKDLVVVNVPRAERRKRPVYINGSMENGTYKRNGEGDYHCSITELKNMLRDSSDSASPDSEILTEADILDLDEHSISSFRERLSKRNPSHPWNDRSNEDFLRLVGAISKDGDGIYHPTVAGILMFGYDYSIMAIFPNYHLDYLEFLDGGSGWSYRISTGTGEFTGNIYSFIVEVSNRISLNNGRSKELDGIARIDDTMIIRAQRELLVNALVNADYHGLKGIRAELRPNSFMVRNPGNLRIPLNEMFDGGVSDPRNPHIAVMLSLIGLSERAGSGVSDIVATCNKLGLPYPSYIETSDPETVTVNLSLNAWSERKDINDAILDKMRQNPSISLDSIAQSLGVEKNKLVRRVNSLKDSGRVERIGGTRGRWAVND